MAIFTPKTESCDLLADKAINQTKAALDSLIDALAKADEAVSSIDGQLESLMKRKDQIMKRRKRLEIMIDNLSEALHPIDPNEIVINA
mgnify:CR=1 FL=1